MVHTTTVHPTTPLFGQLKIVDVDVDPSFYRLKSPFYNVVVGVGVRGEFAWTQSAVGGSSRIFGRRIRWGAVGRGSRQSVAAAEFWATHSVDKKRWGWAVGGGVK